MISCYCTSVSLPGDRVAAVPTIILQSLYLLLAALLATFLHIPIFSHIVLLILVPLNAAAEAKQSKTLALTALTMLIGLTVAGERPCLVIDMFYIYGLVIDMFYIYGLVIDMFCLWFSHRHVLCLWFSHRHVLCLWLSHRHVLCLWLVIDMFYVYDLVKVYQVLCTSAIFTKELWETRRNSQMKFGEVTSRLLCPYVNFLLTGCHLGMSKWNKLVCRQIQTHADTVTGVQQHSRMLLIIFRAGHLCKIQVRVMDMDTWAPYILAAGGRYLQALLCLSQPSVLRGKGLTKRFNSSAIPSSRVADAPECPLFLYQAFCLYGKQLEKSESIVCSNCGTSALMHNEMYYCAEVSWLLFRLHSQLGGWVAVGPVEMREECSQEAVPERGSSAIDQQKVSPASLEPEAMRPAKPPACHQYT